jgi:RNA polymerase sigma-70 factor (ECF subfamily)
VNNQPLRSDKELVDLIANPDTRRSGVEVLFSNYSRPFKRYFVKHRLTEAQAEDLSQDVFVSIVRSIDQFRGDCPLEAWLWKIARNCLISFVRQHREETGLDDEVLDNIAASRSESQADPAEAAGLKECVNARFAVFAKTHPDRAQALALLIYKDWDIPDLATILNRTGGATREYLSQCRKLLRPFLEDCLSYLRS